jgi:radical SAM superfamily enzyme YgiQ (UPF0313 family)
MDFFMKGKRKVLLLNPPGGKLYMRDYYCSKIAKAAYSYHPIDFIILSGILSKNFNVYVLDCIAQRYSPQKSEDAVAVISPDVIIFLSGAVSMSEDFVFLESIKQKTNALMIGSGDIFLEHRVQLLREVPFIDAVLLDFTTEDIVSFLEDRTSQYYNIAFKDKDEIVEREERHLNGFFSVGRCRHELFKDGQYIFPFSKKKLFATILTSFGCPFSCNYCVVNRFGYKERPIPEVIQEMQFLNSINIQECVFKDQTFAVGKDRAAALCEQMLKSHIKMGWTCFTRSELVDKELLQLMKRAGCHTIIFGIESSNKEVLSLYNRAFDLETAKKTIKVCADLSIETVGTFILGFPHDTKKSMEGTIYLSKTIGFDYASFNIFTPAYGTKLRNKLIEDGCIEDTLCFMDSGISRPVINTADLSSREVWLLRRKAIRSFYFNFHYIVRRISRCKNFFELNNIVRQAAGLIGSL